MGEPRLIQTKPMRHTSARDRRWRRSLPVTPGQSTRKHNNKKEKWCEMATKTRSGLSTAGPNSIPQLRKVVQSGHAPSTLTIGNAARLFKRERVSPKSDTRSALLHHQWCNRPFQSPVQPLHRKQRHRKRGYRAWSSAGGCERATRMRSMRRSVDARTSSRRPSSSTTSPRSGMWPAISDTRPPSVVDS